MYGKSAEVKGMPGFSRDFCGNGMRIENFSREKFLTEIEKTWDSLQRYLVNSHDGLVEGAIILVQVLDNVFDDHFPNHRFFVRLIRLRNFFPLQFLPFSG